MTYVGWQALMALAGVFSFVYQLTRLAPWRQDEVLSNVVEIPFQPPPCLDYRSGQLARFLAL